MTTDEPLRSKAGRGLDLRHRPALAAAELRRLARLREALDEPARRGHGAIAPQFRSLSFTIRHCEERSDEATQPVIQDGLGRFAALAMTTGRHCEECNDEATQPVIQDGLGRFAALAMTTDRHCEERSDEATQRVIQDGLGRFAALAMTTDEPLRSEASRGLDLRYRPALAAAELRRLARLREALDEPARRGDGAIAPQFRSLSFTIRHCEACNDEATQPVIQDGLGRFVALAITTDEPLRSEAGRRSTPAKRGSRTSSHSTAPWLRCRPRNRNRCP